MLDTDFLEPERLRAFVAVADTGSFSKAAKRLRLAQPTVSIQIRRLEEAIGCPLFERRAAYATLTKTGEAMLGYARELLEVIGRARRQFAQPPLEGSVRLGLVEDFNYTALAEILANLRRRHARFELFVATASTAELFTQLRDNALDVILTKRMIGSTGGDLICRQKMTWVGRPETLQGEDDVVPLVVTSPDTFTREIILRTLQQAGRRWSIRFEASSISGLHAAVLAGLGVTAFGVGMVPPDLTRLADDGALPPIDDAEFIIGVNSASRDPVVATFADLMRRLTPLIIARLEEEQSLPANSIG